MPSSTVNLHRLVSSWGEGTTQQQTPPNDSFGGMGQGAPASDGDVTWIARYWGPSPILWDSPGGDFLGDASASAVIGAQIDVPYAWASTPELVADVQQWLDDPTSNFGWVLVNEDEQSASTFRVFYSRQTATSGLRPVLTVSYVPEPPTRLAALAMVAPLHVLRRRRRTSSNVGAERTTRFALTVPWSSRRPPEIEVGNSSGCVPALNLRVSELTAGGFAS